MPRVPYVFPEPGKSDVADKIRERRGGELIDLDGAMLNAPALAFGLNVVGERVRVQNSLKADIREMIMLRVAALNGAAYEWIQHEPFGRRAGLTNKQLMTIRDTSTALSDNVDPEGVLSDMLRVAMIYTDWMTRNIQVPQNVFDDLKALFDNKQIVEVTFTAAAYNMVSRTLVALDVGDQANVPVPSCFSASESS